MKLVLNENLLRVVLIILNFVFSLLGVALITLGILYVEDLWWLKNYVNIEYLHLSTLIIVLGCLSCVMSIVGCFCARSQKPRFFHAYIVCLIVLLLLELSISIIAFLSVNDKLEQQTRQIMIDQVSNNVYNSVPRFYDVEEHYKCCGIDGVADYTNGTFSVQYCCVDENDECTELFAESNDLNYLEGCLTTVVSEIQRISEEVGYYAALITLLQVIELISVTALLAAITIEEPLS